MRVYISRFAGVSISILLISISIQGYGAGHNSILEGFSVANNGMFVPKTIREGCKAWSDNGKYWCDYDIGRVRDEMREMANFRVYDNDRLLYALEQAPGSDVYISNSGICAFMDHSKHFEQDVGIHFYSAQGRYLFTERYRGAFLFGFSPAGNRFGVGTPNGLFIIDVANRDVEQYEKGFQFDVSEDEEWVAVAPEGKILIYHKGNLVQEIDTEFQYTRKVKISSDADLVAAIDKRHLKVFSLADGDLLFTDKVAGDLSFRDILIQEGNVFTGVHYRGEDVSKGILKEYDRHGVELLQREEDVKRIPTPRQRDVDERSESRQDPIPWPFAPFDSMHTVWNYYEQHMGGYAPDFSYLHQGLDIIVPIGEPTYAVQEGIVKCVLTTGGTRYWRVAVSPEQSPDYSDGWLYAHLIRTSIQVEVGDTVELHDYLGDIVEWTEDWGHIHFVEIRDSGLVWLYEDNEWGINFNPLIALQPDSDWIAPVIEDVFEDSKFGYCLNESSTYLDPDSLYGCIDIIAKVVDYVGDSGWQQPAYRTYYWVRDVVADSIVFPRTLGQILNHSYDFYESEHYEPYTHLLYKRDAILEASFWEDSTRNFYHMLTNNNGDSLIDLSERFLSFHTVDYPDGEYRIFVEVFDEYGNSVVDSEDVQFRNDSSVPLDRAVGELSSFQLNQNYPNPFNPVTTISYTLPVGAMVTMAVYDLLGRKVRTLVDEFQEIGRYSVVFDGDGLSSGIYFCQLTAGDLIETRKMLLVR